VVEQARAQKRKKNAPSTLIPRDKRKVFCRGWTIAKLCGVRHPIDVRDEKKKARPKRSNGLVGESRRHPRRCRNSQRARREGSGYNQKRGNAKKGSRSQQEKTFLSGEERTFGRQRKNTGEDGSNAARGVARRCEATGKTSVSTKGRGGVKMGWRD